MISQFLNYKNNIQKEQLTPINIISVLKRLKEGNIVLIRLEKTVKTHFDSKTPRRSVAEKVKIKE